MSDLSPGPNSTKPSAQKPTGADKAPPNVKIYDRPDRPGLSPAIIAVIVIVLVIVGVIAYKMFVH